MKPEGLLALAPGCLNPGFTVRKESKLWRSFVASALVSPHLRDTFSVGMMSAPSAHLKKIHWLDTPSHVRVVQIP